MEPVGVFLDEDWELLRRMFSTEEADFMIPLHEHDEGLSFGASSSFWPTDQEAHNMGGLDHQSLFSSSDILSSNFQYFYQENNNSSGSNSTVFFPTPNHENSDDHVPITNNNTESINFCVMGNKINNPTAPVFVNDIMEDILYLKDDMISSDQLGNVGQPAAGHDPDPSNELQLKRKSDIPEPANTSENPKKKSCVSRNAQTSKKNAQTKKNHKQITMNGNDEDQETNAGPNGLSSSCYSSEDDSNIGGTTTDSKGSAAALNLKGKTRAGRGAATDPQSLYARKRRERINERLRILQSLVPNGTKVDISTMLEEAVLYVKFLQLQIKLLSSDDLWMYAPIAYNGMDIGLYRKISPTT